jgi:hypothetical protein
MRSGQTNWDILSHQQGKTYWDKVYPSKEGPETNSSYLLLRQEGKLSLSQPAKTLVPSYYCLYSLYNKIRNKGKIVSAGY